MGAALATPTRAEPVMGRTGSNSAGEEDRKRVVACDLAERMRRDLGHSGPWPRSQVDPKVSFRCALNLGI